MAVKIAPNPALDFISISGLDSNFDLTIFDSEGKAVFNKQQGMPNEPIQISHLPEGVFYAQILTKGNGVAYKKVVKQK